MLAAAAALSLLAALPARASGPMQSAITATNAVTVGQGDGAAGVTPRVETLGPLSDGEAQGFGCLSTGLAATALTWVAGTNQMIMVVAGGTLAPTNPLGVALAVTGTVFASVCAVGALATPAVVRLWRIYVDGMQVRSEPLAPAQALTAPPTPGPMATRQP